LEFKVEDLECDEVISTIQKEQDQKIDKIANMDSQAFYGIED